MNRRYDTTSRTPWLGARTGVAQERLLAQLVAVCDASNWFLLRRQRGLSPRQTRLALTELLEGLLAGRSSRPPPARGRLFPTVPILLELHRRGHEVVVLTLVDEVAVPAGRDDVGPVPSNARVGPWVPHAAILPLAAIAVTHGGMGATQKALAAGVPVVIVPFGRDPLEVARRVKAAGVGVLLPRRRLGPEAMRDAVNRARALAPAA